MGRAHEEATVTVTSHRQRLLKVGGGALLPECDAVELIELTSHWGSLGGALAELLTEKNGFYAFEASLLMRPLSHGALPLGVLQWNVPTLWKQDYSGALDLMLCFAEDAFGNQFALHQGGVVAINCETAEPEQVASSLEGWARVVLEDYSYRTGYPLAHDWQLRHGPLQAGQRLLPKIPFVTGGAFEVDNLYAGSDIEGMRFRGSIARQIRDVPDGSQVVFRVKP